MLNSASAGDLLELWPQNVLTAGSWRLSSMWQKPVLSYDIAINICISVFGKL